MWSSTETSGTWCKYRYLSYDDAGLHTYNYYKDFRYSVRCLKDGTVGIEGLGSSQKKMKISPNPAHSSVFVEFEGIVDYPIGIGFYDMSSRLLKEVDIYSSTSSIDISDLPIGVYFIQIFQLSEVKTVKLIKR